MLARCSGELTASATLFTHYGILTRVKVITDGSNVAKAMLYDTAVGMTDAVISDPGLAIGSDTTAVSTDAFEYIISGTVYAKAAVDAGTKPGNDVVPQNKYGAVALDIGTDGTIDVIEAADNATGYDTAALAIAAIPAVAASHVRLGTVTAIKTDGAFTFGTTALNAANSTVAYTSVTPTTLKKVDETSVVGASHYGGGNITVPVEVENGLHVSLSGTGASVFVDYI